MEEAVAGAVRDVLETMFFTCVYGDAPGGRGDEGLEARVLFGGQRPGEFRLAISPRAAREIAASFLGLEDERQIGEEQVRDVVCEVANMVCGSALSRLAPDLAVELKPPRLAEPGAAGNPCWQTIRTFDLGDGSLTAAIRFEQP
jgi:CheY-specific phosphatase CheX